VSNVTLSIGGRSYTVACAEGEEDHVLGLGAMIDGKLAEMGDMSGQSESRMLLFAALLLADEAHESARKPAPAPIVAEPAEDPAVAQHLAAIAARLENLAERLEH
jgi:cell division protein ZapA